jgi:hypothetical protein
VTPNPASSRPGPAELVSLRQLADGATQTALLDADGQLSRPLVLVDLDGPADPALLAGAVAAALTSERILIGVRAGQPPGEQWHDLLGALDLTLARPGAAAAPPSCVPLPDPIAAARSLEAAAAANPQAAVTLTQVLHASARLDVRAALDVESFAY